MLPATRCPTTAVASAGHGNTTGSPPRLLTGRAEHRRSARTTPSQSCLYTGRLLRRGTGNYAAAASQQRKARRLTESTVTHRGTHSFDPNIGTRARLPVCNPNPNRVKEKRRPGWRTSLSTGHHRHRAGKSATPPSSPACGKKTREEHPCSDQRRERGKDLKNPNPNMHKQLGEEEKEGPSAQEP